jgi:hypothetical protein
MIVGFKVATLKFELDAHLFPPTVLDFPPRNTVWKARLDRLDLELKTIVEHSKEIDNSLLVGWGTCQRTIVNLLPEYSFS